MADPKTKLAVMKVTPTGVSPVFEDLDPLNEEKAYTFMNSGREIVIVKNGGATDITATVDSVRPCSYGYDHDIEVSVEKGKETWFGPFDPARFNTVAGEAKVTFSSDTDVTVAVVAS